MAYEYDHDCPFEAFITNLGKYNEGELVGEWVKFPTTSEELQKVFERIGIGSKDDFGNPYEEWFISDYDCYVMGCMKSWENMKTWMNSIIWLPSSMSWMIMIITIFRRQCRSVIIQAALKM